MIIGGGFGGLYAAKALKRAPVDVTLIDRHNYHLFQPLMYQVATGSLSPGEIAAPLRGILSRQKNTRVLLGEVVDIDPAGHRVALADGASFGFDYLIVASGSQSSYYGHDGWSEWAPSLKTVEEATNLRHKILYAFEAAERTNDPDQRSQWLTFVIVGAGATGVEVAGALAEIARQTLKNDFRSINSNDARIILADGAPRILPSLPEDLALKASQELRELGVEIRTGLLVTSIGREGLTAKTGEHNEDIAARTIIWAGGVGATGLGKRIAEVAHTDISRTGRIKVNPDLTLPGFPDIYLIGDLAGASRPDGSPLPGVAQVAMQQGGYAANVIVRRVKGKEPPPPFHYFDKGDLAVIGRGNAVANVFGIHLWGLPAWIIWASIHLMYLVQFQNRLVVFVHWAFQYLTFSRGARLITGPFKLPRL